MSKVEYQNFKNFLFDQNNKKFISTTVIPEQLGEGWVKEIKVDKNIFLVKSDIALNKSMQLDTKSTIDGFVLMFHLEGEMQYKSLLSNYKIEHKSGFMAVSIVNNEKGTHKLMGMKNLLIVVKKEFLEQNLSKDTYKKLFLYLEKKNFHLLLKHKKTEPLTAILVNEIYNTKYQGDLERVFIHSKVLEILFIELNNIFENNKKNIDNSKLKLDNYDVNAIKRAKEVLLDNMQNPPSVIELAKYVKLNEFKLKTGFKQVFKITPYKLLHEHRMKVAKKLLENGDLNATEVANKIGYKYVHNFSKVFKEEFNVLPKDLMAKRKHTF